MKAIEFLKKKGLLADYASTFQINGHFGTVALEKLLDEYAAQSTDDSEVSTSSGGPGGTDPGKGHGTPPTP